MEAADIGAIFSVFVAAFVLFKAIVDESGPLLIKLSRGVGRIVIIALFAGFIATQTVVGLVGSQITGISGTGQDTETKIQHWDWATQWSVPKIETLGLFIPGLFGYRMDTPKDMMPFLQDSYRGGNYWGGIGRDPAIDRFFDSGEKGSPPPGMMRFSGGGNYAGVLVTLVALWAIAQSLRRQNSVFVLVGNIGGDVVAGLWPLRPFLQTALSAAVCLNHTESMQIPRGVFVGAGHSVRLRHPWHEPALSGNTGGQSPITAGAIRKLVEENSRL
jgi:hypothetical protein